MKIKSYLIALSAALVCLTSCNNDDNAATITYTITFDTREGSSVPDQSVAEGGTVTRPDDPTLEGHSFGGWYTDEGYTTEFDFETEVEQDIQLYAKWDEIAYTVSFETGEGTSIQDQSVVHGGIATSPDDPTWDGHTFEGWYSDEELTQEFDFDTVVEQDIQLYAKWDEIVYTVSFDTGEGTSIQDQSVVHGGAATSPDDPAWDGHTFMGWYSDEELTQEFDFDTVVEQDIQLYAKWDEIIYTVSFETGAGTSIADQSEVHGGNVTRPNPPTLDGYSFGGWYSDATLTIEFDFGTAVVQDIQICAKWMYLPADQTALVTLLNNSVDPSLIDTRLITDMSYLFFANTSFNGDISQWDTSNVTNMDSMFYGTTSFDQDISGWDVSQVTNMGYMFFGATSFDQDITGWDVSNVTNMGGTFNGATSFDQDISGWDISNVVYMAGMFAGATSFDQNISGWDVSHVTVMDGMFKGATSFNQDVSSWDVSQVTNMGRMFENASSFDQDLSGWDVTNVSFHVDIFKGSAMENNTAQQPSLFLNSI